MARIILDEEEIANAVSEYIENKYQAYTHIDTIEFSVDKDGETEVTVYV